MYFTITGECTWYPTPKFQETPTNVTFTEGEHAFLPCRVANLGDRSVSVMKLEIVYRKPHVTMFSDK